MAVIGCGDGADNPDNDGGGHDDEDLKNQVYYLAGSNPNFSQGEKYTGTGSIQVKPNNSGTLASVGNISSGLAALSLPDSLDAAFFGEGNYPNYYMADDFKINGKALFLINLETGIQGAVLFAKDDGIYNRKMDKNDEEEVDVSLTLTKDWNYAILDWDVPSITIVSSIDVIYTTYGCKWYYYDGE